MSRIRPPAPVRRTAVALLLVALAAPALSACTDGSDTTRTTDAAEANARTPGKNAPAPAVTGIRKITSTTGLVLPLERQLFSDPELGLVMRAREKLIQSCMRGLDHDYTSPKPQRRVGPKTLVERRYGLADARLAADHGYHMPGRAIRPDPELPDEQYDAITGKGSPKGVPRGGCAGAAERRIAGETPFGPADIAQDLNGHSYRLSMRDRRVKEVFRSWSSCMRTAGHTYPDPMKAMSAPGFSRATTGVGEVDTAMDDVACKKKTNLIGIWYAVETAYQHQLIEQNAKKLEAVTEAKRDQLKAARKVMDSST
ncbi:hypothetical protein ABT354_33745 [Streptomyces sp. NPDC000594]|uniref:hypothetical protein n=1 Tax=Streptomyces sp. NPDC000594 TaxID=3154261 RepID=UPI00331DE3E0